MKKMYEYYEKFAEWICSFTADKYVHFIVGLLIAYTVGRECVFLFHLEMTVAFTVALTVAAICGIAKEGSDSLLGKGLDFKDFLFTSVGGIIGALLLFL